MNIYLTHGSTTRDVTNILSAWTWSGDKAAISRRLSADFAYIEGSSLPVPEVGDLLTMADGEKKLFIGVILLLFANRKIHNNPYILVMNCADEKAEKAVLDILKEYTEHHVVKSKTITASGIELTAELRTKDASTSFVNLISRLPGVENATLVSYNGEYLS